MNRFDRIVSTVFPFWAKMAFQRDQLFAISNAYEAAQPGRNRKASQEASSGNVAVERGALSILRQARALDQNHDIAKGILNSLVNRVVGPRGIGVEFMPKNIDGSVNRALATKMGEDFEAWSRRPEVTKELNRSRAERLLCRSWLRDGEVFVKHIIGDVRGLTHSSSVPYSFEMLESDFVPFDLTQEAKNVIQGIEINAWGQRTAYHVLKQHPGDYGLYAMDTKRVNADRMSHARICDRLHQLRGVSIFSSILTRLQDIKDYEESERVAARIAAAMAAYIKKGEAHMYNTNSDTKEREIKMSPGMVFDNLRPGEEIGTLEHNRPNSQLGQFRSDMLKAAASGTMSQYSTISKDYNGTYSAQRQELIEQQGNYLVLTDEFIDQITEPCVRHFVSMALASNRYNLDGVDRDSLFTAEYQGPALPWIDPKKEAEGYLQLVRAGFQSKTRVIRSLGGNPQRVTEQIIRERKDDDEAGVIFTSDPRHEVQDEKVVSNPSEEQ